MDNHQLKMDWDIVHYIASDNDFARLSTEQYGFVIKIPKSFLEQHGELVSSNSLGSTYECGEYPRSIVDAALHQKLESMFHRKELEESDKQYTLLTGSASKASSMQPYMVDKTYKEYSYQGRKFIRILSPCSRDYGTCFVKENSPVWIEVKPIEWKISTSKEIGEAVLAPLLRGDEELVKKCKDQVQQWIEGNVFQEIIPGDTSVMVDGMSLKAKSKRKRGYDVEDDSNPMSITEQIAFYVRTGKTFMLHGPAGIGKSQRVEEADPNLTAIPLWNGVLPEDIVGKIRYPNGDVRSAVDDNGTPVSVASGGVWVAPEWYEDLRRKCQEEPDKMHVLFIDEVTNARPATQSLIFNIALRKSISANNGALPPNSVVVLAGNSKEESGAAYNMPEPLFRRMAAHIYLKPDITDWLDWASQKSTKHPENPERLNIHPAVAAFVAAHGKSCFYTAFDEDAPELVMDPRGWEQVSDIIYDNGGRIRRELIANKLGKELTAAFVEFAKNPPITAEEIISDETVGIPIPQRPDEKMALIYGLRHVEQRHVKKIRDFLHRNLGAESLNIFDAVWSKGDKERMRFIAQLKTKPIKPGIEK